MEAGADARAALGRKAEQLAAEFYRGMGFEILARNVRVGRLELDLIVRKARLVVFCEVRARSDDRWVSPADTITGEKIARVRQAARGWISAAGLKGVSLRCDAICVLLAGDREQLTHYPGAF